MSQAIQFYLTTLLIYFGVDVIACWAMNLQFGVAGILNLAFIVFQAAGAYTAAVLTLGPQSLRGGFQQYIIGGQLPFPLPLLAAAGVGAVLALLVGLVVLRRLRSDYQAITMLVISIIATVFVTNQVALFNGDAGLALVPQPMADRLNLTPVQYAWVYVVLTVVVCLIVYFFVHRITDSPLGRVLRAVRDNEPAATALGKNVNGLRMLVFVVGGVIASVSGALLVEFITAWSPGGWLYSETFVYFAAVFIGGRGNNFGAVAGALLVPVAFNEASRFINLPFGYPGMADALQWIVIALFLMGFMYFRPQGIFPERRRRFPRAGERRGFWAVLRLGGRPQ